MVDKTKYVIVRNLLNEFYFGEFLGYGTDVQVPFLSDDMAIDLVSSFPAPPIPYSVKNGIIKDCVIIENGRQIFWSGNSQIDISPLAIYNYAVSNIISTELSFSEVSVDMVIHGINIKIGIPDDKISLLKTKEIL